MRILALFTVALCVTWLCARACEENGQYNDGDGCRDATVCYPGETESRPLSPSSDRVCTRCSEGTTDKDANPYTPCVPCRECKYGAKNNCTATADTVCHETSRRETRLGAVIAGGIFVGFLAVAVIVILVWAVQKNGTTPKEWDEEQHRLTTDWF